MRKIILLLFIFTFLLSCSNQNTTLPVASGPDNPINVEITPEYVAQNTQKVNALLEKSRGITNYHYFYDTPSIEGYEVTVKDNKIKKAYTTPLKLESNIYYSEVYLDSAQKTAIAICTKTSILCDEAWGKAYSLNYASQLPEMDPIALINQVKYAEEAGSEVIENRQTTILEYTNSDGRREQLSVDNYYGIPLQQIIYENDEIIEKRTFTKFSIGNVKESEVTMPSSYKLGE